MEENARDDAGLLRLASLIDDGQPIDWDKAEAGARDDNERAVLGELRLLAALAHISRDPENTGPVTEPGKHVGPYPRPNWGTLTLLEPVGRGAFGMVYRARDNLGREVALKLFPEARRSSRTLAARVLREGSLLAKVKHQNVVVVYGVDRFDDQVGLWMEFIRGRTLEDELKSRGPLGAEEATPIGVDLCRALAAVHGRGLLHRDIKPQNVMREDGGRIVLMDFGAGSEQPVGVADPEDVAGTSLYLAPELFDGRPPSRASDIYSLGVLLFRMVTGGYPVDGRNRSDIGRAHRERKRQLLHDLRPDLPIGFVRAIERAIAADPAERYQTAGEFEGALARSGGFHERPDTHQPTRPRRVLGAAAIAAAVLLVAVASWWIASSRRDPAGTTSGTPPSLGAGVDGSIAAAPYSVKASFFNQRAERELHLTAGDRVALGDRLFLRIEASTAVHVYVVNTDERGESFLLFPLPGRQPTNPLTPSRVHRLPGQEDGRDVYWEVSSQGGREHFLVMVSPTPMTAFEPMLRALPSPVPGKRVSASRVPDSVIGQLRGVGGLVAAGANTKPGATQHWFEAADQLRSELETVRGPWIRQLTLENPIR